jgi:hypothetical protein
MDWTEKLFVAGMTALGGVLVKASDYLLGRKASRTRKAEALVELYADFMVSFHAALDLTASFCARVVQEEKKQGKYDEPSKAKKHRQNAEKRFRELAWRLRFLEPDSEQAERIEKLVIAFEKDFDLSADEHSWEDYLEAAKGFPKTAEDLRKQAKQLVEGMRAIHRNRLLLH